MNKNLAEIPRERADDLPSFRASYQPPGRSEVDISLGTAVDKLS